MAVNETLTARIRNLLPHNLRVEEKKMFRGVAFMVNDKMCITAGDDELMFRIDPSLFDTISSEYQAKVMIMRGKALKGYVTVKENTLSEAALKNLINLSLEFNGKAKRSKEDSD